MKVEVLQEELTVCKVSGLDNIPLDAELCFLAKTKEEISLVCYAKDVPKEVLTKEDGWRGLYIPEVLDFSLVGILSKITETLAKHNIPVFVVSTYNTDYVLVKKNYLNQAKELIEAI